MKNSLYIHVPFCLSKCPYCDFNSYATPNPDYKAWLENILSSMNYWSARIKNESDSKNFPLSTIFFGGGTPSLLEKNHVSEIINKAHKLFGFNQDIEISLEANPTSVELNKFKDFAQVGINRLSLGVQSLNADDLKFLGREHSLDDALKSFAMAQSVFERCSFDLIYALPNQSLQEWEKELKQALSLIDLNKAHLSLYELTIEQGTKFFQKGICEADEHMSLQMYELTQAICESVNMPAYEVSNHAIKGFESQHNLNYWQGGQWLGLGAGSHSRLNLNGKRAKIHMHYKQDYLQSQALADQFKLSYNTPFEDAQERLLSSLRLSDGYNMQDIQDLAGIPMNDFINWDQANFLQEQKLIAINDTHIKTINNGKFLLNSIIAELLK